MFIHDNPDNQMSSAELTGTIIDLIDTFGTDLYVGMKDYKLLVKTRKYRYLINYGDGEHYAMIKRSKRFLGMPLGEDKDFISYKDKDIRN